MPQLMDNSPIDLRNDLDYQAGAIVSRILLKQSIGSVTAFAFAEGTELSEHTCPFEALLQVIEGEADVTIGGVAHTVQSGQVLKLPANIPHAVRAPQAFKMLLVMLRASSSQDE